MSGLGQSVKRRRDAGSEAVAKEAPAPLPPARLPGALVAAALAAEAAGQETAAAAVANDAAALAERARTYLPRDGTLNEADARVVASNGAVLPVHRQVLLLASPVLRKAILSSEDTVRTLVRARQKWHCLHLPAVKEGPRA